jgi:hypothetical protein
MIKQFVALSTFLCLALSSEAQLTPSTYLIGGSSSFQLLTRPSGDNLMRSSFAIQPEFGKFVSEKWYIGGGLGYSINNDRIYLSNQKMNNRIQILSGNFVATRYYPLAEKFYFTLEYGIGASYFLSENDYFNGPVIATGSGRGIGLNVGVSPGLAYFVNPKWMIFARMGSLGYNFSKTINFDNAIHSIGYSFQGNSFGLGVRYVLGTGK